MLIGSGLTILSTTDTNAVLRLCCGSVDLLYYFVCSSSFTHPISRAFTGNPPFPLNSEPSPVYFNSSEDCSGHELPLAPSISRRYSLDYSRAP